MSYLPTLIVVVVGLVLLVVVFARLRRHVRGFNQAADAVRANIDYETGTLRARLAALRVAMKETRARVKHAPAVVPSNGRGRQEEDRG
ncbi:bacteriophage holin [Actinophytocola sp.]|uniref:bacteriophage holin n=1 Tax=Actinophytocola sp. TaxID=1872138 RepID=UPI002ED042F4